MQAQANVDICHPKRTIHIQNLQEGDAWIYTECLAKCRNMLIESPGFSHSCLGCFCFRFLALQLAFLTILLCVKFFLKTEQCFCLPGVLSCQVDGNHSR